jgi:hypothetical protein
MNPSYKLLGVLFSRKTGPLPSAHERTKCCPAFIYFHDLLVCFVFALPGQYSAARKQLVQVTLSLY